MQHIDYAVVAKTHPLMYKMHKYWGRKPYNVIAEYINHYTKKDDIILDPFCGSGVTAIEAIKLKRKVIAVDLNPMALFITKMTLEPLNLAKFEWAFQDLKNEVHEHLNKLYETKCPKCGQIGIIHHMEWDAFTPVKIIYFCSCSKKLLVKDVENWDFRKIADIKEQDIPFWYPKTARLPTFRKEKYEYIHQLFTHRNLISLSLLFNAIDKIEKFVFTSSLAQASMMKMITKGKPTATTKGWIAPRYYVPQKNQEINVWINFETRFNNVFRGKKECNKVLQYYQEASNFEDLLNGNGTALLMVKSALDLSEISTEGIDYIFTDPPYGGNIQYLGLSAFWGAWLKYEFNEENEITISNHQKKDSEKYHEMMERAFSQMYRVLKRDRFLTVSFHNTKKEPWDSMVRTIVKSQFKLEEVIYQSLSKSFSQSVRGHGDTPPGDYFIRFQKLMDERPLADKFDERKYENTVVSKTKDIIAQRNEPTPLLNIMTQVYKDLNNSEILFGERSIGEILEDHKDKDFIQKEDKYSKGENWWLRDTSNLSGIPLSKRVEKEIMNILSWIREGSSPSEFKFDILQGISRRLTGPLTPNPICVMQIVGEIKREKEKIKKLRHNRLIYYLAAYGKQEGFDIGIGEEKRRDMYRSKKLGDFCTEKQLKTFSILQEIDKQTDNFDMLWIKEKLIIQLEIKESSAKISETVIKNWKIIKKRAELGGIKFLRIFIIPHEKKDGFYEESFRQQCGEDWSIVYQDEFYELMKQHPPDAFIKEDIQFWDLTKIRKQTDKSETSEKNELLHTKAVVIKNEKLPGDHFKMVLRLDDKIEKIEPGQFLHILCDEDVKSISRAHDIKIPRPFLRRPISIHSIYYEGFSREELADKNPLPKNFRTLIHRPHPIADILYKKVGVGTEFLSSNIKRGDEIDILGPLGKGIEVDDKIDTIILVAGGIGVAPLMALAERLRYEDKEGYALIGALSRESLPLKYGTADSTVLLSFEDVRVDYFVKEFREIGVDAVVATEDDTLGTKGKVTYLLNLLLRSDLLKSKSVMIFSCGPKPMLKEVAKIAKENDIPCKVLLEERMACGVGACLSCACKIKVGKDNWDYKLVCRDGPTFNAEEVIWD
jgi:NAD(P)H-flavin reductase/16S rRNA G966 N2-methylase RsmD